MKIKSFIRFLLHCFLLSTITISAKTYKIGLAVWSGYPNAVQGFKDGLASRGLIEDEQLEFIHDTIGADKKIQSAVAQSFKQANVDMVFTLTTPGTTIMKAIMPPTTPLVFSIVTYPADSGLIESFEYSGNNLVGTSNYVPLTYSIDLMKNLLPSVKSAAIFHRKGEPNSKIQAANLYRLLKKNNVSSVNIEATTIQEVKEQAIKLIGKVDLFITTTDTLMQSGGESALIEISLANKIPILSSNKQGVQQGSTFGVVADFYVLGKMSGLMASQILLDGKKPEAIHSKLQTPPTYLVNKKSLEKLAIKLPDKFNIKLQWIE